MQEIKITQPPWQNAELLYRCAMVKWVDPEMCRLAGCFRYLDLRADLDGLLKAAERTESCHGLASDGLQLGQLPTTAAAVLQDTLCILPQLGDEHQGPGQHLPGRAHNTLSLGKRNYPHNVMKSNISQQCTQFSFAHVPQKAIPQNYFTEWEMVEQFYFFCSTCPNLSCVGFRCRQEAMQQGNHFCCHAVSHVATDKRPDWIRPKQKQFILLTIQKAVLQK